MITEKNINCHNCNILSKCRNGTQLYQTHEILINILKRDLNRIKFYDKIDISDFVLNKDINNKLIYYLYVIITYEQNIGYEFFVNFINNN